MWNLWKNAEKGAGLRAGCRCGWAPRVKTSEDFVLADRRAQRVEQG